MPIARVRDIEINYRLEGDGAETIVLVNGLADDLETWASQMSDLLAAGYRVLRFDNRGIGATSKPAGPYSSRMLAHDAKALVDALGSPVAREEIQSLARQHGLCDATSIPHYRPAKCEERSRYFGNGGWGIELERWLQPSSGV